MRELSCMTQSTCHEKKQNVAEINAEWTNFSDHTITECNLFDYSQLRFKDFIS